VQYDLRSHAGHPGLIRITSTVVLLVLALAAAYFGIAWQFLIIITYGVQIGAVFIVTTYVLVAFGVPVTTALYASRRRNWDWLRATRLGAVVMLLLHAAMLPFALSVFIP